MEPLAVSEAPVRPGSLLRGLRSAVSRPGLAGSLAALAVSAAVSRAVTFVTIAYTARVLGREAFGLLNFGQSLAAYASILVGPGLLVWGTRAIARRSQMAADYLLVINLVQLALAAISYLCLVGVAHLFFQPAEQRMAIFAGVGLFAIAASVDWAGQGLERFRQVGAAQVTGSLAALLLTVLFVRSAADVYRVPLTLAAGQIAGAATLLGLLIGQRALPRLRREFGAVPAMLRAALPLGATVAMVTVLHYANSLYLEFFRGAGELGIFAAAYRLVEVLTFVPGIVSSVFLPRLARGFAEDRPAALIDLRRYIRLVMSLGFLPAVFFAVEPGPLVSLVYGPDFAASAPVVAVFAVAVLFNFAAVAYINALLGMGRDRGYVTSISAALVVSVVGGLLTVPRYGLWGATTTVAVLDLVTWLAALPFCLRAAGSLFLAEWVRPLAAALVTGLLLAAGRSVGLPFLVAAPLACAAYLVLVVRWSALRTALLG